MSTSFSHIFKLHHKSHCSDPPILNAVSLALFHIVTGGGDGRQCESRKCGLRSHPVTSGKEGNGQRVQALFLERFKWHKFEEGQSADSLGITHMRPGASTGAWRLGKGQGRRQEVSIAF